MAADPPQREADVTRNILDQLLSRHRDAVPEEVIRRTFEDCLAHLSSARIRDFVPVLAHRCAKAKLEALAAEPAAQREVGMAERQGTIQVQQEARSWPVPR